MSMLNCQHIERGKTMFFTKECDYAIRMVRGLANMEVNSTKVICEREHVPKDFAYKILKKLEKKGIVKAYRGNDGGYKLHRELDNITLIDIVRAVDEQLLLNECLKEGHICPNNIDGKHCNVNQEFMRVQDALLGELGKKTMKELV